MDENKSNSSRKHSNYCKLKKDHVYHQLRLQKFGFSFYKILSLIFIIPDVINAKLPFIIETLDRANLSRQVIGSSSSYTNSHFLPTYLTDQDFINAKYVETNKPLKLILNDQHFSVSAQLKVGIIFF